MFIGLGFGGSSLDAKGGIVGGTIELSKIDTFSEYIICIVMMGKLYRRHLNKVFDLKINIKTLVVMRVSSQMSIVKQF